MVDPLSPIASLLTLTDTALTLGKATTKLIRAIHDAPEELRWVSSRILQTRAQLLLIMKLQNSALSGPGKDGDLLIPSGDLVGLRGALQDAMVCVEGIEEKAKGGGSPGRVGALRWVMRDKRVVEKLLGHLREVERSLELLLTTISTTICAASYTSIIEVAAKQDDLLEAVSAMNESLPSAIAEAVSKGQLSCLPPQTFICRDRNMARRPRVWGASPLREHGEERYSIVTSSVVINSHWNDFRSISSLSAMLRLPFILSGYAIAFQARVERHRAGWPTISHSITVKNIVPADSRMMVACLAGDLSSVRELIIAGKGSPTDIDDYGKPAIRYAVKSGSTELVKFLLENGADANAVETRCLESPLELACRRGLLDIARLLLSKGACVEHVDLGGCTPLINLWYNMNLTFSRIEFLKAMAAFSFPPICPEDGEFLNPLISVAMRGSAEDIDFMIKHGASVDEKDVFGDRIIKYCIWGSNPPAYDRLVTFMPATWITERNNRGRTSLHHALEFARASTPEILRRLLRAGADVHSRDSDGHLPEDLAKIADRRTTHAQVWKTGRCRNFETYLDTLRECGYQPEVDVDGDIFWPTETVTEP